MKVHTGRGDDGTTGLLHGGRVPKSAAAPRAYGAVDEAVAALGLARAEADGDVAAVVLRIQRELFVVAAELATSPSKRHKLTPGETAVTAVMCESLGALVVDHEGGLPELTEFVVPGDNRLSSALDFARTVLRRAEREAVAVHVAGDLDNPHVLRYLNLAGDLLFLLARTAETSRTTLHEPVLPAL